MRKTKIIATLGPATDSPEMIGKLIDAGMNIARLNMSHAPHDWVRRVIRDIREAARQREASVAILLDTQGPAIRTGDLPAKLDLLPGQKFTFTVRGERSEEVASVDVNYENFINDISVGDIVLVDNGAIHMRVLAKAANKIECEVLTPGSLGSRRHINLPGVKVSLPALTAKDLADIAVGLECGVDYVALSFCREAKDLRQLRAVTEGAKHRPMIVAKIEDQQAIKNLDEIITESDAIMVARGDLGIEIPFEELPIVQRKIVKTCLQLGRPVIVATHMLESMISSPVPTRAEITDVANAVFEQADAIMLSGETTVGQYPLKCLEIFDRVAKRIERSGGANYSREATLRTAREKLVKTAVMMADELRADALITFTRTGTMPRVASWLRPHYSPIYAFCETAEMAQSLAIQWGVRAFVIPLDHTTPESNFAAALKLLVERKLLQSGATTVIVGSLLSGDQRVDAVQMRVVQ